MNDSLKAALEAVAGTDFDNASKLGKYLARNKGKVTDGLKLEQGGERHHAALWQVSTEEERELL